MRKTFYLTLAWMLLSPGAVAQVTRPQAPTPPLAPSTPLSPAAPPAPTATPIPAQAPGSSPATAPSNGAVQRVSGGSNLAFANEVAAKPLKKGDKGPAVLKLQVLLDRANFSSGEIDGSFGQKTATAIAGFQTARQLPVSGEADAEVWRALSLDTAPILTSYTLSDEDVSGPFEKIPEDMEEKAKLPALGYQSPLEGLGEKFHASPSLLKQLNPDKSFDRAGETLLVPNVNVNRGTHAKAARVVVNKSDKTVRAIAADGTILAQFPASMGSVHDPLPIGHWKIKGVAKNPVFYYNPALFWDADPSHSKAKIPPGPNNPVGMVWIDLSKEHYGIHGTPEPSKISRTQSHGCIRLTNWDVQRLSHMVSAGMPADLQE